jgi:hypothetical protein
LGGFGDRVWVEKVLVETVPEVRGGIDAGPLGELDQFVRSLRGDPAELAALGDALTHLMQKLPPAYRQSPDALRPDDPDRMRRLVDQAHALLAARLGREGAAP